MADHWNYCELLSDCAAESKKSIAEFDASFEYAPTRSYLTLVVAGNEVFSTPLLVISSSTEYSVAYHGIIFNFVLVDA